MSETRREDKPCACKGIRSCLLCEPHRPHPSSTLTSLTTSASGGVASSPNTRLDEQVKEDAKQIFLFCARCNQGHLTSLTSTPSLDDVMAMSRLKRCAPTDDDLDLRGIDLFDNFITLEEETELIRSINHTPWVASQSGRRKQDYGPKVNFKRKKIKASAFSGLPSYSAPFVQRMLGLPSLSDFIPVELCNLEYLSARGSAIDAHFDDFWLWGERLVTLNMVSDTVYTMTQDDRPLTEILIHFPRLSLIVMRSEARYEWMHAIQRIHVAEHRMATTLRELTSEFMTGGAREDVGKELVEVALKFEGSAVGTVKEVAS